ncbi:hypothetical protein BRD17_03760 [Halobacteriales archaeon SW_7_68_16]|nr:MAG: hypothetical protein BRD17_03760 [Halobacteriales archaeon SW_7_68_16]
MVTGESTEATADTEEGAETARGGSRSVVVGAFRGAIRSESLALRAYGYLGGVVAVLIAVLVVLALPQWVVTTLGSSASNGFSQGFLFLVGLAVLVPLVAPAIYAARRHRHGTATRRRDAVFGTLGLAYLVALYLALVISAPAGTRGDPPGAIAGIVEALYGLPPVYAVIPPVGVVVSVIVANRLVEG